MIAAYHAQAISEAQGARLVGVAGRSEEKARSFAQKAGAPFWTASVDALVSRPDIDVICIATPSGAHLEPALAAIRAGKHVVVEKPLEIDLERVDAVLDAAQSAGVRVAAIFQSRFGAGAKTVKAAIDAGRFGKIVLASAYVKWQRTSAYYSDSWHGTLALDGGGALMNQGIHAIDLLQWFAGLPTEVSGWTTRCVHTAIEAEDTACAALRFAGGGLGAIEATTAAFPGWSRRIEICGENGSASLEDDRIVRWDFRVAQPEDSAILSAAPDEKMRSGSGAPNQISHYGHLLQIQDLIESIRTGRPLAIDGRAARNAVAVIRAVYESAATGRPAEVSRTR
jgi:predicted dehydrogenase